MGGDQIPHAGEGASACVRAPRAKVRGLARCIPEPRRTADLGCDRREQLRRRAKGGLGALALAKQARAELELAIQLDPSALAGSAYSSLGTLYHKVPSWPIGFGSDRKADEYLHKALATNPNGIDPNFFYGELLLDQGKTDEAIAVLERALAAPARPGRELADEGRRREIRELLAQARKP